MTWVRVGYGRLSETGQQARQTAGSEGGPEEGPVGKGKEGKGKEGKGRRPEEGSREGGRAGRQKSVRAAGQVT